MGPYMMYGLIGFLVCIAASRLLAERGLAKLTVEEKALLIDRFSNQRKYSMVPLIIMLAAFFGALKLTPEQTPLLVNALLVLSVLYVLASGALGYRTLKAMNCPPEYIGNYLAARTLSTVGMVIFFVSLFLGRTF
jgi:hypothetical protein